MTEATGGVWRRLRDRKIAQWGFAYAAAAWGFLQGLQYVSEAFAWPGVLRQVAVLACLVGLPIVLVIAWYHGDRGEQRVSGAELAILSLLFLIGGAVFWRYERANESSPATVPPGATADPTSTRGVATTGARPSIAVLPFANRSANHDDAFFVDGIHDDILTQLTKIGAMTVIARTSVEQFRDTKLTTREIGEKLGATNVLEGGVQRSGTRVRVTVQLIDTATDAHLWAEHYDRELTAASIFAIQSEVAASIAAALKAELTAAERSSVDRIPTRNLDAWEAYQIGKQRLARRTSAAVAEATEHFTRAVALDPGFALAHAGLADATLVTGWVNNQSLGPVLRKTETILARAIELDPGLAEAHTTAAKIAHERHDYERAEAGFRRAIALNPNYPTAHHWYAALLMMQGRYPEALQSMQRAIELDPLSVLLRSNFAGNLASVGRLDDALEELDKAERIDPERPPNGMRGYILGTYGRLAEAIPVSEKAYATRGHGVADAARLGQLYLDLEDDSRALQWLDRVTQDGPTAIVRAYFLLYRNEHSQALVFAQRALQGERRDSAAFGLLRDADLRAGNIRSARERYAAGFPELMTAQPPVIDAWNINAAIDFSLVLQLNGEHARASRLLDQGTLFLRPGYRLGPWGYGIADAQIHALRGDSGSAIAALRSAAKEGWRGPYWRYYRDFDPALESVRSRPEFQAVFAEIERDVVSQRASLGHRATAKAVDLAPNKGG